MRLVNYSAGLCWGSKEGKEFANRRDDYHCRRLKNAKPSGRKAFFDSLLDLVRPEVFRGDLFGHYTLATQGRKQEQQAAYQDRHHEHAKADHVPGSRRLTTYLGAARVS